MSNVVEQFVPEIKSIEVLKNNDFRIILSPIDCGFAHVIGNSLRRILLSSIPGSAVTEVKIDNVFHEYSNLDGIQEDIVEIL